MGSTFPTLTVGHEFVVFGPQTDYFVVDFAGASVKVVTEKTLWPQMPIRRASVNSFGYGGANAHCILDHVSSIIHAYDTSAHKKGPLAPLSAFNSDPNASSMSLSAHPVGIHTRQSISNTNGVSNGISAKRPKNSADNVAKDSMCGANCIPYQGPRNFQDYRMVSSQLMGGAITATRRLVLLPFTGHDEVSLESNITAVVDVLDTCHLSDLAYTLASRRSDFFHRAFTVVDTSTLLHPGKYEFKHSGSQQQNVGFIFTGKCSEIFSTHLKRLGTN